MSLEESKEIARRLYELLNAGAVEAIGQAPVSTTTRSTAPCRARVQAGRACSPDLL